MNSERPQVAAMALVINEKGKILLIKSPKWNGKFIGPGGHIERGETIEEALKREVKEETGIEISDLQFLNIHEFVFSNDYNKEKHIIGLSYLAKTRNNEEDVILDEKEATEYKWVDPEQIVNDKGIYKTVKDSVESYLQQKRSKEEEYKIGWQRAVADYQNLQRETLKRQSEWAQMSERQIIEEFIPVYDHFKKAFAHHPELKSSDENNKQIKNWIDGIGYIMKQFGDILKTHNIEEVKTIGEKFDPRFHESAGEEEAEGEPGTIIREVSGGYKLKDMVIKPARVILIKN